jgi:hypothetical protein
MIALLGFASHLVLSFLHVEVLGTIRFLPHLVQASKEDAPLLVYIPGYPPRQTHRRIRVPDLTTVPNVQVAASHHGSFPRTATRLVAEESLIMYVAPLSAHHIVYRHMFPFIRGVIGDRCTWPLGQTRKPECSLLARVATTSSLLTEVLSN